MENERKVISYLIFQMSVIVSKDLLSDSQITFLKLTCTYAFDPTGKSRPIGLKKIQPLKVNQTVKNFAELAFFQEMSEMMRKYLGQKVYDFDSYTQSPEPICFYAALPNGDYILPYTLTRLLLDRNLNFELTFPKVDLTFKGTLREEQVGFCKIMLEQLLTVGTTTMGVYPSAGKTIMGAYLGSEMGLTICVMITLKPLIKQWRQTFETFTNVSVQDGSLWLVGEKLDKDKRSESNEFIPKDLDRIKVLICMDERLGKIPVSLASRIGTVIFDEAHQFCVPSRIGCWMFFQPRYIIIETATVERPDDGMERVIYASAGVWGVSKKSDKVYPVYKVETQIKGIREPGKKGPNYTKLVQSILYDDRTNQIILAIIKNFPTKKILILTKETKHIDVLFDLINSENLAVSKFYGDMTTYKNNLILIGTPGKLGTGFDEATFSEDFDGHRLEVLILTSTIRKFNTLEQNIGRVLRSEGPIVFTLVHNDGIFKKHWELMTWWFEKFTQAQVKNK